MEIISLESENVKRIKAIRIEPYGKPVVLTGGNAQGKSSVIDSLFIALTGKLGDRPVRDGSAKARITLDTGEYIIERVIPAGGSPRLTVRNTGGEKISSPQTVLDTLVGSLTLDPLAFTRLKDREQREMLLKVAGVNLLDWEQRYKSAYDTRTIANRDAKRSEASWQSLPSVADNVPNAEASAKAIIKEIDIIREAQELRAEAVRNKKEKEERVESCKKRVAELEMELKEAQSDFFEQRAELEACVIPKAPSSEELQVARVKLEGVEETNKAVRQKQAKLEAREAFKKLANLADKADDAVQILMQEKATMLEQANFGVDGLSVSEDGVTYEGIPFSQLSTAEQVRVSTAMAIQQNPRLKIIIIREGALIGSEIWQALCAQAQEHGFQLWVEKFTETADSVGLHIEDGEIVARNGEPTKESEVTND